VLDVVGVFRGNSRVVSGVSFSRVMTWHFLVGMAVGRVRVGDPRVFDPSGPGSGTIFSPRVFGFGGPI
jgi:hypothetical protein